MPDRFITLLSAGLLWGATACARTSTSTNCGGACPSPEPGTHVIPTRYVADRFLAVPVLPRGDTASIFLDTGSSSFVMEPYLPWLEITAVDSVPNGRGGKVARAPLPKFRGDQFMPAVPSGGGQLPGISVRRIDPFIDNNFLAWIAHSTQAQLGGDWFDGHVWTFDYPRRRLLMHASTPAGSGREVALHFAIDTTGHRVGHTVYVDVVVAGDTLAMIFDTGASIWLSAPALERIHDGGPAERSTSHVWEWQYKKWRSEHPDWPVIEHGSLYRGLDLIRVPSVSIAGYELGPTWLSVWAGTDTPPKPGVGATAWTGRFAGTLGGSLLRNFVVTVDYPRGMIRFERAAPR